MAASVAVKAAVVSIYTHKGKAPANFFCAFFGNSLVFAVVFAE